MSDNNLSSYWFDMSDYDIETAKAMLSSLTATRCGEILQRTEELYKWIKQN